MKKAGEKVKAGAAHIAFVLLLAAGLYFAVTTSPSITGHAVLDAATSKAKLETALSSVAMFDQVQQGSICIYINDAEHPLSLQAQKSSTGWKVSEMVGYCSGQNNEDLILQFPDYDSFSSVMDNPSPRNLAGAAIRQDFQIIPSKYVEKGGNVICDATFRVKFCNAIKNMASDDQLIEADLTCCLDELTRAQNKLLQQHLQEGSFTDEIGLVEENAGNMGMYIMMGVGGLVLVLLVVGGAFMLKGKTKPAPVKPTGPKPAMPSGRPSIATTEMGGVGMGGVGMGGAGMGGAGGLMDSAGISGAESTQTSTPDPHILELQNYVADAMVRGYSADEIRTHLLEIGWDSSIADNVLRAAEQQLQNANG